MSKYDEPEPVDHWWDESPAVEPDARYEEITQEYQDRVTSELKANIEEFLSFASMHSLITLIVESA